MRADLYLVTNGFYESRARAQAAIKAGLVKVDGKRLKKASEKLSDLNEISAKAEHPWVSRGGLKLAYALKEFGVSPEGKTCLDVGASTGGFTDVLLQNGAAHVYAVDVGHGQLHAKLQGRDDVTSMENTDARNLRADMFSPVPTVIVCDASFISLTKVLSAALSIPPAGAQLIALIKPQFEVGKGQVGKGGIVRDEKLREAVKEQFVEYAKSLALEVLGLIDSPVLGKKGNKEILIGLQKREIGEGELQCRAVVES